MQIEIDWLIVFLIQNVEAKYNKFVDKVLSDVMQATVPGNCLVQIALECSSLSDYLLQNTDKLIPAEGSPHSVILELNRENGQPTEKKLLVKEILEGDQRDFTSGENVEKIFLLIKKSIHYKRIILFTWDHGSAFGIFESPFHDAILGENNPPAINDSKIANKEKIVGTIHPSLIQKKPNPEKKIADQEKKLTPPRCLTMEELADAIAKSFVKLDALIMDNCYMQLLDTCITLQRTVRFLVASEGALNFNTFNYDKILQAVGTSTSLGQVKKICDASIASFDKTKFTEYDRKETCLFTNRLYYFAAINFCINRMVHILIKRAATQRDELIACRKSCVDLTVSCFPGAPYQLIDAKLWFKRAGWFIDNGFTYKLWYCAFSFLKNMACRKIKYTGKTICSGNYAASSFSLYFPKSVQQIEQQRSFYVIYYAGDSRYITRFTKNSVWDDFLNTMLLPKK